MTSDTKSPELDVFAKVEEETLVRLLPAISEKEYADEPV
jgi:hypothetical protein